MESDDSKRRRVTINGSRSQHPLDDIIVDIASKYVTSAATYAALRSVCRSWRAVLPATVPGPDRLPPQVPFVLLLSRGPGDPTGPAFSLATNRTFTLRHLADARRSACIGSCYGWLLLLDPDYNLILRNPFTGDTIRLPSLEGTLALDPPPPLAGPSHWHYKQKLWFQHHFLVRRAILSSDPSADRDFLVVLFTGTSNYRCFTWRSGDNFWTVREHPPFHPNEIMFYKDRRCCIAISFNGECAVFDFATADGDDGFFKQVPKLAVSGSPFLVEWAGNVWLVTMRTTTPGPGEGKVKICRLDLSRLPDKVTVVSERVDLGGRILFLEQCNSMSVASAHFPGFQGDSVYFTKISWCGLKSWHTRYDATIWERQLKNGITRRLSIKGECGVYYLWPKLWWVPPNLHKKLGD